MTCYSKLSRLSFLHLSLSRSCESEFIPWYALNLNHTYKCQYNTISYDINQLWIGMVQFIRNPLIISSSQLVELVLELVLHHNTLHIAHPWKDGTIVMIEQLL